MRRTQQTWLVGLLAVAAVVGVAVWGWPAYQRARDRRLVYTAPNKDKLLAWANANATSTLQLVVAGLPVPGQPAGWKADALQLAAARLTLRERGALR